MGVISVDLRARVSSFHPKEYDLINLYEVTDPQGIALWGRIGFLFREHRAGRGVDADRAVDFHAGL